MKPIAGIPIPRKLLYSPYRPNAGYRRINQADCCSGKMHDSGYQSNKQNEMR